MGALIQQGFVGGKTKPFRDEIRQRANSEFGSIERGNHSQQIGSLDFSRCASKHVQAGGYQSLLDLENLLVEFKHAPITLRIIRDFAHGRYVLSLLAALEITS